MHVLGLIPARRGSKGVPKKNLVLLAGRPLLSYTCEAAAQSRRLTRTIVSTDDEEVAACARASRVEVPFMRPPALATDETPTLPVVQHALTELERREAYHPDVVVILQPTSPLRRAAHIDAAVDRLIETGAESIVSVVEVPHQFNPVSVLRIENDRIVSFLPDQTSTILRRQDKPQVYARNGAAVYAVRRDTLLAGTLFGRDCRPLVMRPEDSVDIDGPLDLLLAEALLNRQAP